MIVLSIVNRAVIIPGPCIKESTIGEETLIPEEQNKFVCCCCRPTPPCLFGGVLPYFEVTGNPVPVSSLRFKCPDYFI